MAVSSSIFLYITGGRTLWVPGHTPAPGETKPVQILNFASPRELSRSFYLFDMPIQIVNDPSTAAMIPGGKTPEDVITAVNEFRRVCMEDQDFLLKRCYDANKPPPPSQNIPQQQQPQQQPQPAQQQQPQQFMTGISRMAEALGMRQNPTFNASGTNLNQALLLQLLQQQQQQQQQRSPMPPHASPLQQPPPMTFNRGAMMGSGNLPAGGNMMMNSAGMMPSVPSAGFNNNYFNPMMSMGGRSAGLMPPPNTYPLPHAMGTVSPPIMGHRGAGVGRGILSHSPFQAPVRDQPEALPNLPPIPPDILEMYMNPQQKLMCATMPGPRCTVWLREHEIPPATKNPRYVFCKGGIVLMLKTKGSEVANSKPVELFEQQVCAHFLIHNYCSRSNCLHRHHTETQLRQLIAGKHVELKSMTKKERHRLSELVLEKEREGLARAAEDREKRSRDKMEAVRRRGGTGGSTPDAEGLASTQNSQPPVARVDVGSSDDEDNDNNKKKNESEVVDKSNSKEGSNDIHAGEMKGEGNKSSELPQERHENETVEKTRVEKPVVPRRVAPFSSRRVLNPADIGVTDDDDDDEASSSSSSSSSVSSSASSSKSSTRHADTVKKTTETASENCDHEKREGSVKVSVEATAPDPLPPVESATEEGVAQETHDARDEPAEAVKMTEQPQTVTTAGKENVEADEAETTSQKEGVDVADKPTVVVAAEEEEEEWATVEKNEEENTETPAKGEQPHPASDDALQVAEGDGGKKNPKGKTGGTKRARSPVAKKSTAKGKKSKK
ncbi:hypothetical protein C3747_48g139 [Trypanosoma cruzi]|uniref:C3H1-type domain-containing protein n=2 Tax=Trypanosoma cruzi TaxID=5693 RepID=Q4DI17_TRYCC|nr:hypothetical protein, conserved [Trypanosoma cruzi]EAN92173.1 hypothetical protein, conserved [Trypanosoma cruzi]PWV12811.1 hypothetical protein C3747_48g139 [Trypanosoma cruzi]RNC44426.1 hypothetical protein TcCL_NonESM05849 [Trypanosoma cruzi]|eukprot:XP_814024.1 hypothetical protein [Trypanosoma cruzi strain CL Brener]